MGIENKYQGIDEYAVRLIRHKARELVGRFGYQEQDRADLEQELICYLVEYLPSYNPERASRNTFISRLIKHKIHLLIRSRKVRLRDGPFYVLDDPVEDGSENVDRIDTIDFDEYLIRTGKTSRPGPELRDLQSDVETLLKDMPSKLRQFCLRLKYETITEISRDTGIPRSTIYEHVKKLRVLFGKAGLRDYFQKDPTHSVAQDNVRKGEGASESQ